MPPIEPGPSRTDDTSVTSSLELFAGERVLWSGRPKSGIVFTGFDAVLIPFSMVWLGFTIHIASFARSGFDLRSSAVTTFFLAIGLYMAIGRFIVDWSYRSRLQYIITTQRIVIISHFFGKAAHSIGRAHVKSLRLQAFRDGTGTIHLAPSSWGSVFNGSSYWHACFGRDPMLFRISDA